MKNNIFLAKIVTFNRNSLLFEINNLVPTTEEYRLVAIYDKWAYDLQLYCRYLILGLVDDVILPEELNKIREDIKYVYSYYALDNIFNYIKEVFDIKESYQQFLNNRLEMIKQIHEELSSNSKVIDISKIKSITNKRKI